MTLGQKEDLPKWMHSVSGVANQLAPGLLVLYWLLTTENAQAALTSPLFKPPSLVYDILNIIVAICIVIVLPFCGAKVLDIFKTILNKNV